MVKRYLTSPIPAANLEILCWWTFINFSWIPSDLKEHLYLPSNSPPLSPSVPPVIIKLEEPERRHHTCIEFTVRGFPHPTLQWLYKGHEIQAPFIHTEMELYQDYLEGCLNFENPTHLNNGNYTLVATNSLGSVNKTVFGHFLAPPPFLEDDGRLFILKISLESRRYFWQWQWLVVQIGCEYIDYFL